MLLGETTASARRIGPIPVFDTSDNPVDPGTVTLRVRYADGTFGVAGGSLVSIGNGYAYYQATQTDALAAPWVAVQLSGTCKETVYQENLTTTLHGISVSETDPDKLRIGPIPIFDTSDAALTSLVGVTCEVTLNGAAWGAPVGTLTFVENGYADYVVDASELAAIDKGWIAIKVSGTAQEFVLRADVGDTYDVVYALGYADGGTMLPIDLGETDVLKKTITFMVYTSSGLPASGNTGEGAVLSPVLGDLQVNKNLVGYANAAGTFAHIADGKYRYVFHDSEVSGATEGYVLFRLKASGHKTITLEVPLRSPSVASILSTVGSIQTTTTELHKIGVGRWKIFNNQLTIYDVDGSTPLRVFDLLDDNENPSMTKIFERLPVP